MSKSETDRMKLTAISVISLCNTEGSLSEQEMSKDSPYWTVAFEDVKTAIRREIRLIEQNKEYREILKDFLTTKECRETWIAEMHATIDDVLSEK